MRYALFAVASMGCLESQTSKSSETYTLFSETDTLAGWWEGDLICQDRDFFVQSQIKEPDSFEYTGQMLFEYTEPVSGGTFQANLLYDFTAIQTYASGSQDIYFDMTWSALGCLTTYDNGEEESGGCQSMGLNTSDFDSENGTDIGDVPFYFDGGNRLAIDDGNCAGILYRE